MQVNCAARRNYLFPNYLPPPGRTVYIPTPRILQYSCPKCVPYFPSSKTYANTTRKSTLDRRLCPQPSTLSIVGLISSFHQDYYKMVASSSSLLRTQCPPLANSPVSQKIPDRHVHDELGYTYQSYYHPRTSNFTSLLLLGAVCAACMPTTEDPMFMSSCS